MSFMIVNLSHDIFISCDTQVFVYVLVHVMCLYVYICEYGTSMMYVV